MRQDGDDVHPQQVKRGPDAEILGIGGLAGESDAEILGIRALAGGMNAEILGIRGLAGEPRVHRSCFGGVGRLGRAVGRRRRPMKPIEIGIKGQATVRVTSANLASSTGSGAVDVFSTPNLVLLMEEAAMDALRPFMDEGQSSVGSLVNIRHIAPTPIDFDVTATATLTEIDGRRLVFKVEAHDCLDCVGEGTHERFIISLDRFNSRASEKSTRRNISSVE